MSLSDHDEAKAVPLPRGRHKLSRAHVRGSQRARLVDAMLARVGEVGYSATTVHDVVARARVSRNAFYELFDDKEACFIAASDDLGAALLRELYAFSEEASWLEAVRKGLRHYLAWWRERPRFAVAYLVELPAAGQRALEQRDRSYAGYADLFERLGEWARVEQPELPPMRPLAPRVLVTTITELVGQEIRAGGVGRLSRFEDELLFFLLAILADDATARRETG